jgi:hypothetical protein
MRMLQIVLQHRHRNSRRNSSRHNLVMLLIDLHSETSTNHTVKRRRRGNFGRSNEHRDSLNGAVFSHNVLHEVLDRLIPPQEKDALPTSRKRKGQLVAAIVFGGHLYFGVKVGAELASLDERKGVPFGEG